MAGDKEALEKTPTQIIRDYFTLPGTDFLGKYPMVEERAYWDGEEGEGLIQALVGYRKIPELPVLSDEEIKAKIMNWGWILSPAKMSDMLSQHREIAQAQLDDVIRRLME